MNKREGRDFPEACGVFFSDSGDIWKQSKFKVKKSLDSN